MKFAVEWPQPVSLEQRIGYAETCAASLKLKPDFEVFVDGMDDAFNSAFCSWPTCYYVIDSDATLLYIGGSDDSMTDRASYDVQNLFCKLRNIGECRSNGGSE
jgi:hypothetical protein